MKFAELNYDLPIFGEEQLAQFKEWYEASHIEQRQSEWGAVLLVWHKSQSSAPMWYCTKWYPIGTIPEQLELEEMPLPGMEYDFLMSLPPARPPLINMHEEFDLLDIELAQTIMEEIET